MNRKNATDSLFFKIQEWAIERNLHNASEIAQMLKLQEECGELAHAIGRRGALAKNYEQNKNDHNLNAVEENTKLIKDSLGDIIVVLTVLSTQLNLDLNECMQFAYDEIKHRKGKLINGVFVKEQDL